MSALSPPDLGSENRRWLNPLNPASAREPLPHLVGNSESLCPSPERPGSAGLTVVTFAEAPWSSGPAASSAGPCLTGTTLVSSILLRNSPKHAPKPSIIHGLVKSLRGQLPTIMAFWGRVVWSRPVRHSPPQVWKGPGKANGIIKWASGVGLVGSSSDIKSLGPDPQGAKGALGSPVSPLLPSGTWIAWHLLATLPSGSALCPIVWHPAPWESLRWSCLSPNLLC